MDFLLLALLAGFGIALLCAPLGVFVVWQKMAYFGDSLAHSALLGVAFGIFISINIQLAIFLSSVVTALLLFALQSQQKIAVDTLLGIISHSCLAFGLILVSVVDAGRLALSSYLLGDILSTTTGDLWMVGAVLVTVALLIWRNWSSLLMVAVDPALAQVEGVPVKWMQCLLLCLLSSTIAVAINVVGVLLITALLIIPAAAARFFAKTPETMVFGAALIGCLSVVAGLLASLYWDTPAGPSIVAGSSVFFILILLGRRLAGKLGA